MYHESARAQVAFSN